ncbi:hypothetical protein BB558_004024 [Smittium angustum]|uniref:DASH complex subunit DAD4 n=1 Tax=Smittium angustum TaxID=133377 RepID=A0A2U1J4B9_SMIAN|nr:hypothetical protein BB558_005719 [Smittium angustum]PVZ99945.1 hypothetical protein BB558_004024 [Smittium angustum]
MNEFKRVWLKKEAYPIIGIVGIGAGMVAYHSLHKLTGTEIVYNHKGNPFPSLKNPADYSPSYLHYSKKDVFSPKDFHRSFDHFVYFLFSFIMDSPYTHQQDQILLRIIGNVKKINNAVDSLNSQLDQIISTNNDVQKFSQLWRQYNKNSATYLKSIDSL